MKQRILDYLREREIRRLSRAMLEAIQAGDAAKARRFDEARYEAIWARSPQQVERMEIRLGLRPRIMGGVLVAFLCGHLPASVVSAVFRLLKLRSV
jgi:hypothetical protein